MSYAEYLPRSSSSSSKVKVVLLQPGVAQRVQGS